MHHRFLALSPRPSSHQDVVSPDSAQFTTSPTPIITGEDTEDMETRGKELASRCWNDNDDFLAKEKIAEWLGGQYDFLFPFIFHVTLTCTQWFD